MDIDGGGKKSGISVPTKITFGYREKLLLCRNFQSNCEWVE